MSGDAPSTKGLSLIVTDLRRMMHDKRDYRCASLSTRRASGADLSDLSTKLSVMYATVHAQHNPLSLRPLHRRNLFFHDGVLIITPHVVTLMDSETHSVAVCSSVAPPTPHPFFEWLLLAAHAAGGGPQWLAALDVPLSVMPAAAGSSEQATLGSSRDQQAVSHHHDLEVSSAVQCASVFIGAELVLDRHWIVQVDAVGDMPLGRLFGSSAVPGSPPPPFAIVPASSITRKRAFVSPLSAEQRLVVTTVQGTRLQPLAPSDAACCDDAVVDHQTDTLPRTSWVPAFRPLTPPAAKHAGFFEPPPVGQSVVTRRTPTDLLALLGKRQ